MKTGGEKEAFHNLSRCELWHLIYFTERTANAHICMSWDLEQDSCFPTPITSLAVCGHVNSPVGSLERPFPLS